MARSDPRFPKVTITSSGEDQETITVTLSEDGQTIIFAYSEYNNSGKYSSMRIGVGVKKSIEKKGDLSAVLPLMPEE